MEQNGMDGSHSNLENMSGLEGITNGYAITSSEFRQYLDPVLDMHGFNNEQFIKSDTSITPPQMEFIENLPNAIMAPVNQNPVNVPFEGVHNFTVKVTPSPSGSMHKVYFSKALNKVYIDMKDQLSIDFEFSPINKNVYVRALLRYEDPKDASAAVTRCLNHLDVQNLYNNRVIRCNNMTTQYCSDSHLSVVTNLPKPQEGTSAVTLLYQFDCKNSCSSGMNRRSVEIIFTLEDDYCKIYGRQRVGLRICSCPKRDKEKDEKFLIDSSANSGKRKMIIKPKTQVFQKKVKKPDDIGDSRLYKIPLNIVGKTTTLKVLEFAINYMSAELAKCPEKEKKGYEKSIADVEKKFKEVQESK